MKSLNELKQEWQEIVFTYEDEAQYAWRTVDVESTDFDGEYQYLSDLINTVYSILKEEEEAEQY